MRRQFSSSSSHVLLKKPFNNLPWNFNSHLRHEKVNNIVMPFNFSKAFLGNEEATSLFKNYADAIC